MQTYVDFFGINGFFKGTDYQVEAAEEIIRILTIF